MDERLDFSEQVPSIRPTIPESEVGDVLVGENGDVGVGNLTLSTRMLLKIDDFRAAARRKVHEE